MADVSEDPREVAWHPRYTHTVLGHSEAFAAFNSAFASGKPHHAWLITGPIGIGKASLAYATARHVLSKTMKSERAHPDLAVLERSLNDSKPRKLKAEISVDDARGFIDFFSRTSGSGGWRVGLVDAADDLNTESANALLKLVEEPPDKALILLVCHAPGRLLRTLRSRCRKLPLGPLNATECQSVLEALPVEKPKDLANAMSIANGSPGMALQLMNSDGAKAFQLLKSAKRMDNSTRNSVGQHFATRAAAQQDYEIFMALTLEWLARRALNDHQNGLALLYQDLSRQRAIVSGYNLDRRVAVMEALSQIDHALKVA
jgi:DNA polymerase III subunit delta'